MRWKEISEAPLADLGVYGDKENAGSYTSGDLRAMHSPVWLKKVTAHFAKCPQRINIYLYNAPGNRYPKFTNSTASGYGEGRIGARNIPELENNLGIKLPDRDREAINFIMLDNEGDDKVGLTPWILVHRFAHAIVNGNTDVIPRLISVVNLYKKYLPYLLTFRSARKNLITRDGEWVIEMVTQYIVKGHIEISNWRPTPPSVVMLTHRGRQYDAMKKADHPDDMNEEDFTDEFSMSDPRIKKLAAILDANPILYDMSARSDDEAKAAFLKGVPQAKRPALEDFYNNYFSSFREEHKSMRDRSEDAIKAIKSLEPMIAEMMNESVGGYFIVASTTGRKE